MTDSGRLLRNVSVATALCATTALLAACGSAGATTTTDAAVAVTATRSASAPTGGTRTVTQKPVDPKAWLIPKDVVSIRVTARTAARPPAEMPPKLQLGTVTDPAGVKLVITSLNALTGGTGALPCPSNVGATLELDFYAAGRSKSPVAEAQLNQSGCNGVMLSGPGHGYRMHQGSFFDQALKELGLTLPAH